MNDVPAPLRDDLDPSAADGQRVERVRAGDVAVFDAIVIEYRSTMIQLARSMVGTQDVAEDLVQDVLSWVWEHRTIWNPRLSIRAYLLRAVRNQALNTLKHAAIEARHYGDVLHELEEEDSQAPDIALLQADTSATLARALLALPERRKLAIRLRYEQQLSHAEIGEVMGISAKAAKELLLRTIESLRLRFIDRS